MGLGEGARRGAGRAAANRGVLQPRPRMARDAPVWERALITPTMQEGGSPFPL